LIGQDCGFWRVLAVFVSPVIYRNLLFSADFVPAGGQDKIPKAQQEIHQLLSEAEAADQRQDKQYGSDSRRDELPKKLARRKSRLKRIHRRQKRRWKPRRWPLASKHKNDVKQALISNFVN
jgi:hypothetical protein